jgi:hypothetical protein
MGGESDEAKAELTAAWLAAGSRLVERGYTPADVTETMLSVALASWTGLRDRQAAARHLRAIADHPLAGDEPERDSPDQAA